MNDQFLQGVIFDWDRIDNDSYLKRIKAFKGIQKLDFNKAITFFVGENGSGKSTLLKLLQICSLLETKWLECLKTQHPDCDFIFIIEGVLMYFYEEQVKAVLHNIASHFSGGEVQKRSTINSKTQFT